MLSNNNRQKSLTRRFLLILGIVVFISVCTLGVMLIFWDRMMPDTPKNQKMIFGGVIIIYAFVRFSRLLKRKPDDE